MDLTTFLAGATALAVAVIIGWTVLRRRRGEPMGNAAKKRIERVGFPDFWEQAFDEVPEGFIACSELIDLENKLFEKSLSEPLHKVIRHLAKISANSVSALTTLLLNGYGPDAMKVAR